MKKSADLSTLFKPLAGILRRFHITLFIVVTVAGLTYAVLSLNTIINNAAANPTNVTGTTPAATTIDEATITRIQSLRTSANAPSDVSLPSGRINPFSE